MTPLPARRHVNPRLGPYFAIHMSACVATVLLALIVEQLGAPSHQVRWLILMVPLTLVAGIGLATSTGHAIDYYAAGRRVPAIYGGATLAVSAFGGTGLLATTGAFFLIGFDALCLAIGGLAGFVVMGILLAPFFRKFGAYTVPSYLGARFESPTLRLVAALLISVPLLMFLTAEIKMAAFATGFLTGALPGVNIALVGLIVLTTIWGGGARAVAWSGVGKAIVMILALLIPVTIVAIWLTNLPLPQLSQGPLLRSFQRLENLELPIVIAPGLAFDMPGDMPVALAKRYAAPFGAIGPHGFVTAMLTIMMGIAVAPWLLPRLASAPGVYHARKSIGWATLIFGVVMLTIAAIAIFVRAILVTEMSAQQIPEWVKALAALGLADVQTRTTGAEAGRISLSGILISRDAVLMALPMAAGMTSTFVAVAAAGALAACLSGASSASLALAATLSEDVWHGRRREPPADAIRIRASRTALTAVVGVIVGLAMAVPADPLALLLWSLALTGSTLFPVMVLSIWWKRINAFGATAGIATGFGVAMLAIVSGAFDILKIDPALAGMFGIPASLAATMLTSLMTPAPSRHILEFVRDIRVPGGEILYDREMRMQKLKTRQRTAG
ncbi:MAG: sodium:solute symporter [Hyphomicrobiaceae bacterium]|nr:sodium:solute symporter [Hyphomicrobiaceae bacterium]